MKTNYAYKIIVMVVGSVITTIFLQEIIGIILLFLGISPFRSVLGIGLSIICCLMSVVFVYRLSKRLSHYHFANALFDVVVFTSVGIIIWVGLGSAMLSIHSIDDILLFNKPLFSLSIIGSLFGFPFGFLSALQHFLLGNKKI